MLLCAHSLCPANRTEPGLQLFCPTSFAHFLRFSKNLLCPATTQATIVLLVFARSCSADGEVWFGKFLTPLSSIGESSSAFSELLSPADLIIFRTLYKIQPGSLFIREPGCLVNRKSKPKTHRLVCCYLINNKLILFKVFKTCKKFVKKC